MSAPFDPERPHRRRNPLTGEWVLVSPHRMKRPWQGRVEKRAPEQRPDHDPSCYLCPGNERAEGQRNPDYRGPWAFTNDFAALVPLAGAPTAPDFDVHGGAPLSASGVRRPASDSADRHDSALRPPGDSDAGRRKPDAVGPDLLEVREESGTSRVVCFSPRHDLTLPEMDVDAIRAVVDLWAREYEELGARDDVAWVQIFENKGELMGCSNPHPHGQIWAQSSIPGEPAKEDATQRAHFERHGRTLLADYLALELEQRERVIVENDAFVALVPFWAVWPFEMLLISREPRASLLELTGHERTQLADILKRVTIRYDNLFETSFPYSMGIHQAPVGALGGGLRASGVGLPVSVEAASGFRRPASESVDRRDTHPAADSEAGRRTPDAVSHWHFHIHFYPPLLRSATVKKFMVGYEMLGEPQRDLTPEAAAQRLRDASDVHYRQAEES